MFLRSNAQVSYKLYRYKFQESTATDPPTPDPNGRKRKVTAENERHARAILGQAKKGKYWIKIRTEVIDFDNAPPGFIPPAFLFKPEALKHYRKRSVIGHCLRNDQHTAHLYRTESGTSKACDGVARTDISSQTR
jgi:hypothetical protein